MSQIMAFLTGAGVAVLIGFIGWYLFFRNSGKQEVVVEKQPTLAKVFYGSILRKEAFLEAILLHDQIVILSSKPTAKKQRVGLWIQKKGDLYRFLMPVSDVGSSRYLYLTLEYKQVVDEMNNRSKLAFPVMVNLFKRLNRINAVYYIGPANVNAQEMLTMKY